MRGVRESESFSIKRKDFDLTSDGGMGARYRAPVSLSNSRANLWLLIVVENVGTRADCIVDEKADKKGLLDPRAIKLQSLVCLMQSRMN